MTIDYEAAKRSLIATRRKNVQAAIDELIYDAERSAVEAWANYDRAKDRIEELQTMVAVAEAALSRALERVPNLHGHRDVLETLLRENATLRLKNKGMSP